MCWVTFYQDAHFQGHSLPYTQKTEVPHLDAVPMGNKSWQDEMSSLKLGPESWLVMYKDGGYKGSARCFGPNTIVRHLSAYDFNDSASSFKLYDKEPEGWQPSQPNKNSGTLLVDLAAAQVLSDFGDLVASIIGSVPKVGSALKGLVTFLWPDNSQNVWREIRKEVTKIIRDLVDQVRAEAMENRMQGLNNLLQQYLVAGGPNQRSQLYTSLLAAIADDEPYYLDQDRPGTTLVYFVNMATIALAVLAEQCLFYEKIYGEPDKSAPEHLAMLREKIQLYRSCADQGRMDAMTWRLGLVTVEAIDTRKYGHSGYWAVDSYDGWKSSPYSEKYDAERDASKRQKNVQKDYDAALDVLLFPTTLWKYFDPTEQSKPVNTVICATSGPFGGSHGQSFADAHDQRITKVIIYAGSRVDGIEVFYGEKSGGLHGGTGGTKYVLVVDPADGIIAAYGTAGDSMDQLFLRTALGKDNGGGGSSGSDWSAVRPAGTDAVLGWISGVQGTKSLESLTFHWVYLKKS